ncbi:hypothetical protein FKM82_001344 [Ascaphus truei]
MTMSPSVVSNSTAMPVPVNITLTVHKARCATHSAARPTVIKPCPGVRGAGFPRNRGGGGDNPKHARKTWAEASCSTITAP